MQETAMCISIAIIIICSIASLATEAVIWFELSPRMQVFLAFAFAVWMMMWNWALQCDLNDLKQELNSVKKNELQLYNRMTTYETVTTTKTITKTRSFEIQI
jgi:hypothetical protein